MGSKVGTGPGSRQDVYPKKSDLSASPGFDSRNPDSLSDLAAVVPEHESSDVFVVAGAIKWFDISASHLRLRASKYAETKND